MNLRNRLLYDARLRPCSVVLIERLYMPETSDQRLEVWVVRTEPWTSMRWDERLDEAMLLLGSGKEEETPVIARWALWQVMPLAERLVAARDTFVKACNEARERAQSVKPDGQT